MPPGSPLLLGVHALAVRIPVVTPLFLILVDIFKYNKSPGDTKRFLHRRFNICIVGKIRKRTENKHLIKARICKRKDDTTCPQHMRHAGLRDGESAHINTNDIALLPVALLKLLLDLIDKIAEPAPDIKK